RCFLHHVRISSRPLSCSLQQEPVPQSSAVVFPPGLCISRGPTAHVREALRFVNGPVSSRTHDRSQKALGPSLKVRSLRSSPALCPQSPVISCTVSAVSGHLLYRVRSLRSSPVPCPQSPVISCTVSAVSGHLLYRVRSLRSSPVLSAVSGHLLYCVCSLRSSPVLCPQSLVISCTMSAVSDHLLYCVRSLWSSPVLCPQSLVIS
ncbi:unnamed protein product, partial [Staurois parvus]